MPPISEWFRRVWYLLNRRRFEDELLRDMAAHRERLDRPARFGNVQKLREDARDAWGWRWLDDFGRDLRLSARTLRRSPMFAVTTVLILTFGVGVNLALFQLVNAALLRPLPLPGLASLVRFDHRSPRFSSNGVPAPMARFVEANNTVLAAVMTRSRTEVAWGEAGEERIEASFVSGNWFDQFGGTAARGRVLGVADSAADAPSTVVISYDFWQRQLAARPDVVGSAIRINDRSATVAGVVSADFPDVGVDIPSVWIPASHVTDFVPGSSVGRAWGSGLEMFARVRPGVSLDTVRASLKSVLAGLRQQEPAHVGEGEWLEPAPGTSRFLSPREAQQVWTVVAAVAVLGTLVLMIACLNLSNLALARAMSRVREMTIRAGLGAGRWRVVRHMLAESAVLAAIGSAAGLMFAVGATHALALQVGGAVRLDASPDWRLGLALVAVALFSMLAVGLIPAWKIGRADLALATRDGGERVTQGLHAARLRHVLVTAQVAGSCLLLVFTAQVARSLQRALDPDPGYDYTRVAVLAPSLNAHGVDEQAARDYWGRVRQSIAAQPEIAATAIVTFAPFNGGGGTNSRYKSTPHLRVHTLWVEPEYFALMRIPVLSGRLFEPGDDPESTGIISRRVAADMYGTLDVIGKRYPKDGPTRTIVGLVGDAHVANPQSTDAAELYVPMGRNLSHASLLVRAHSDPASVTARLREASRAAEPRVLPDVRLMRDDYERLLRAPRMMSSIAGGIAVLALGLACLGVFAVVSHSARVRTREIGIRLALGAPRGSLVRTLLRRTGWAAGIGTTAGLAGAVALAGAMAGAPFYVQSSDPVAYVAALLTLVAAGAAAAFVPAIRTLRADPLNALREN
jgi:macrolide transport system ATP-binding/permease protein